MFIEKAILLSYIITIISESVIVLVIQKPNKLWQWLLGIFFINSLTHPIAIYLLHVQNTPYAFVEVLVFIVEVFLYNLLFRVAWRKSIIISLLANIFSILIGSCIRYLLNL